MTEHTDPNAALIAQAAHLTAQAAVATAEAARTNAIAGRTKAAIETLGLPSYEAKTVLNSGAGAIETLLLASDALEAAAARIAGAALNHSGDGSRPFLVIAGEEKIDFSLLGGLQAQASAFRAIFDEICGKQGPSTLVAPAGLGGGIALISALAGLVRSESEVTAVELPKLSDRLLAMTVAGKLEGRAIFPDAAIAAPIQSTDLFGAVAALAEDRDRIAAEIKTLEPPESDRYSAALERFDAFFAGVTTAGPSGAVPLAEAARMEQLLKLNPLLLRLFVEKAGGSLVTHKNILTFFGFDPVRVSGGLVASYCVTEPESGQVLEARMITCRTRVGTLRDIQGGR